jgi:hypothetical protein
MKKLLLSSVTASSPDAAIASSKPPLDQGLLNQSLNLLIVFDDENDRQLEHRLTPGKFHA